MAKKPVMEETLTRLRQITPATLTAEAVKDLEKALRSAQNIIVAQAAKVAAKCQLADLTPQLAQAFARFLEKPTKTDQGCLAKIAIVEALDALESREIEIFRQGLHYIQAEPGYGGTRDTAAPLRGKCAFALARCNVADIFFDILSLLTDPEPQPRLDAIKVLTYLNEEKSELLLRLKALTGDAEPQILSACFTGLMNIAPERSLPFVATFLTAADLAVAEGAALALGESRSLTAFSLLRQCWEDSIIQEVKQMLLLPLALVRCDEAFHFLLDIVRDEHGEYAAAAVKALAVYGDDAPHRAHIAQAVNARADRYVTGVFTRVFAA